MSRVTGDLYVSGNFAAGAMSLPANAVGNNNIGAGSAGNYIAASKSQQQVRKVYAQPNVAAVTERRPIYGAYGGNGSVLSFRAGSIAVAIGVATVTIDLLKNGVSILTAPITLNNANAARTLVAAAIATAGYAAGDFFEINVVATAGGGTLPTGIFAEMVSTEDPQ